ncbi:Coatomer subunit delta (CopD) [Blattamonas nauphoetae]|uniref:Coatomer subunit delta n=1 Tax=Blattamonas nauphoetae TaxID=2049346 RepID=A0ABQ9YC80_9EUKA|nr:Coatomer subunit delta (CopD) [Blattamonas nauphoetae]
MSGLIGAAILTRDGRTILKHSFDDNEKRFDGLISFFTQEMQKSTFSETLMLTYGSVHFIHKAIDSTVLFLASSTSSNVLADSDVLQTLSQLVSSCIGSIADETSITDKSFEILFAWNEAVACGMSNFLTLEEIDSFTKMHSHEEELEEKKRRLKEKQAADINSRKIRELEELNRGPRASNPIVGGLTTVLGRITGDRSQEKSRGHIGQMGTIQQRDDATAVGDSYARERDRIGDSGADDPYGGFSSADLHNNRTPQTQAPTETQIDSIEQEHKFDDTQPLIEQDFQTSTQKPQQGRKRMQLKSRAKAVNNNDDDDE